MRKRIGYLSELRRATCSEESHSSFCSSFSLAEFLAAASNLSSSSATGPDKVAYPMLKHLPRSGMDYQKKLCTNQQPPQRRGAVPGPVWVGSKWLLAFPRVPVTPGTPLHFLAMLSPERPQKGSTQHL